MRYYIIGAGIIAAAFPAILILSLVVAFLLELDVSEKEIDIIAKEVESIISISNIFVWCIILWLLNKRFDFGKLNWIIMGILLTDIIDLFILFYLDSVEQVELITNYTLLVSSLLICWFGIILFKSKISFYNLKESFSIVLIITGLIGFCLGILSFNETDIESTISIFLAVLVLLFLFLLIMLKVMILRSAHKDKLIEGLI